MQGVYVCDRFMNNSIVCFFERARGTRRNTRSTRQKSAKRRCKLVNRASIRSARRSMRPSSDVRSRVAVAYATPMPAVGEARSTAVMSVSISDTHTSKWSKAVSAAERFSIAGGNRSGSARMEFVTSFLSAILAHRDWTATHVPRSPISRAKKASSCAFPVGAAAAAASVAVVVTALRVVDVPIHGEKDGTRPGTIPTAATGAGGRVYVVAGAGAGAGAGAAGAPKSRPGTIPRAGVPPRDDVGEADALPAANPRRKQQHMDPQHDSSSVAGTEDREAEGDAIRSVGCRSTTKRRKNESKRQCVRMMVFLVSLRPVHDARSHARLRPGGAARGLSPAGGARKLQSQTHSGRGPRRQPNVPAAAVVTATHLWSSSCPYMRRTR